jgi:hypothetical protein
LSFTSHSASRKGRDLATAIVAMSAGQRDRIGGESLFVLSALRLAPCRAMPTGRRAGAALGDPRGRRDLLDTGARLGSFPG